MSTRKLKGIAKDLYGQEASTQTVSSTLASLDKELECFKDRPIDDTGEFLFSNFGDRPILYHFTYTVEKDLSWITDIVWKGKESIESCWFPFHFYMSNLFRNTVP